jgi:hypothetical protein
MGYYMRYLVDDDKEVSLDMIEAVLQRVDPRYSFAAKDVQKEQAELMLGAELYGELEINRRGSDLMDEELGELLEDVEDAQGDGLDRVKRLLQGCRFMVTARVLWQGREPEATLEKIDPLWEWLFSEYRGLMQADGEGYYDRNGQVLEVE